MPYAWAPIHLAELHEDGKQVKRRVIQPGDEVSESDFTKEDWDQLREERVIRKNKFPEGVNRGESVRTALIRQANEARDAALDVTPDLDEPETNDGTDTTEKKPWQPRQ